MGLSTRKERHQRIDGLREIPLVASCTARELARIDRLGAWLDVRPGATLTRQGHIGRECFVVVSGDAVARRGDRQVGTVDSGTLAGELALLDGGCRTATVVAGTSMSLLVLTPTEFRDLLRAAPSIEASVRHMAAERRARLDGETAR